MLWVIIVLLGISAVLIFYQDYRSRSVVWVLFPLLMATGILYSLYYTDSLNTFLINSSINLGFLLIQFLLLKLVFRFRKIVDKKIGTGDILFAVCSCTFFSPVNFLVFYILSLAFSLCMHFSFALIKTNYQKTIPLAGLQAVFLFFFVFTTAIMGSSTVDDTWFTY